MLVTPPTTLATGSNSPHPKGTASGLEEAKFSPPKPVKVLVVTGDGKEITQTKMAPSTKKWKTREPSDAMVSPFSLLEAELGTTGAAVEGGGITKNSSKSISKASKALASGTTAAKNKAEGGNNSSPVAEVEPYYPIEETSPSEPVEEMLSPAKPMSLSKLITSTSKKMGISVSVRGRAVNTSAGTIKQSGSAWKSGSAAPTDAKQAIIEVQKQCPIFYSSTLKKSVGAVDEESFPDLMKSAEQAKMEMLKEKERLKKAKEIRKELIQKMDGQRRVLGLQDLYNELETDMLGLPKQPRKWADVDFDEEEDELDHRMYAQQMEEQLYLDAQHRHPPAPGGGMMGISAVSQHADALSDGRLQYHIPGFMGPVVSGYTEFMGLGKMDPPPSPPCTPFPFAELSYRDSPKISPAGSPKHRETPWRNEEMSLTDGSDASRYMLPESDMERMRESVRLKSEALRRQEEDRERDQRERAMRKLQELDARLAKKQAVISPEQQQPQDSVEFDHRRSNLMPTARTGPESVFFPPSFAPPYGLVNFPEDNAPFDKEMLQAYGGNRKRYVDERLDEHEGILRPGATRDSEERFLPTPPVENRDSMYRGRLVEHEEQARYSHVRNARADSSVRAHERERIYDREILYEVRESIYDQRERVEFSDAKVRLDHESYRIPSVPSGYGAAHGERYPPPPRQVLDYRFRDSSNAYESSMKLEEHDRRAFDDRDHRNDVNRYNPEGVTKTTRYGAASAYERERIPSPPRLEERDRRLLYRPVSEDEENRQEAERRLYASRLLDADRVASEREIQEESLRKEEVGFMHESDRDSNAKNQFARNGVKRNREKLSTHKNIQNLDVPKGRQDNLLPISYASRDSQDLYISERVRPLKLPSKMDEKPSPSGSSTYKVSGELEKPKERPRYKFGAFMSKHMQERQKDEDVRFGKDADQYIDDGNHEGSRDTSQRNEQVIDTLQATKVELQFSHSYATGDARDQVKIQGNVRGEADGQSWRSDCVARSVSPLHYSGAFASSGKENENYEEPMYVDLIGHNERYNYPSFLPADKGSTEVSISRLENRFNDGRSTPLSTEAAVSSSLDERSSNLASKRPSAKKKASKSDFHDEKKSWRDPNSHEQVVSLKGLNSHRHPNERHSNTAEEYIPMMSNGTSQQQSKTIDHHVKSRSTTANNADQQKADHFSHPSKRQLETEVSESLKARTQGASYVDQLQISDESIMPCHSIAKPNQVVSEATKGLSFKSLLASRSSHSLTAKHINSEDPAEPSDKNGLCLKDESQSFGATLMSNDQEGIKEYSDDFNDDRFLQNKTYQQRGWATVEKPVPKPLNMDATDDDIPWPEPESGFIDASSEADDSGTARRNGRPRREKDVKQATFENERGSMKDRQSTKATRSLKEESHVDVSSAKDENDSSNRKKGWSRESGNREYQNERIGGINPSEYVNDKSLEGDVDRFGGGVITRPGASSGDTPTKRGQAVWLPKGSVNQEKIGEHLHLKDQNIKESVSRNRGRNMNQSARKSGSNVSNKDQESLNAEKHLRPSVESNTSTVSEPLNTHDRENSTTVDSGDGFQVVKNKRREQAEKKKIQIDPLRLDKRVKDRRDYKSKPEQKSSSDITPVAAKDADYPKSSDSASVSTFQKSIQKDSSKTDKAAVNRVAGVPANCALVPGEKIWLPSKQTLFKRREGSPKDVTTSLDSKSETKLLQSSESAPLFSAGTAAQAGSPTLQQDMPTMYQTANKYKVASSVETSPLNSSPIHSNRSTPQVNPVSNFIDSHSRDPVCPSTQHNAQYSGDFSNDGSPMTLRASADPWYPQCQQGVIMPSTHSNSQQIHSASLQQQHQLGKHQSGFSLWSSNFNQQAPSSRVAPETIAAIWARDSATDGQNMHQFAVSGLKPMQSFGQSGDRPIFTPQQVHPALHISPASQGAINSELVSLQQNQFLARQQIPQSGSICQDPHNVEGTPGGGSVGNIYSQHPHSFMQSSQLQSKELYAASPCNASPSQIVTQHRPSTHGSDSVDGRNRFHQDQLSQQMLFSQCRQQKGTFGQPFVSTQETGRWDQLSNGSVASVPIPNQQQQVQHNYNMYQQNACRSNMVQHGERMEAGQYNLVEGVNNVQGNPEFYMTMTDFSTGRGVNMHSQRQRGGHVRGVISRKI